MSLNMVLSENRSRTQQLNTLCSQLTKTQSAVSAMVSTLDGSSNLEGAAYDAARQYFREGYLEAVSGLAALATILADAAQAFPDGYVESVSGNDLNEDDLTYRIQIHKNDISALRQQATTMRSDPATASQAFMLDQMIDDVWMTVWALQNTVNRMRDYNATSSTLLADYDAVLPQVSGLVQQLAANATIPPTTPVQVSTLAEYDWFSASKPYQAFMVQYGFDQRSSQTIIQLETALKTRFPESSEPERAYLLNRTLSELDPDYVGFRWGNTAGDLGMYYYDTNIPVKILGISIEDYNHLKYEVNRQNNLCGYEYMTPEGFLSDEEKENRDEARRIIGESLGRSMSDKEFKVWWMNEYNRFHGKADFSHQAFTTAAILFPSATRLSDVYAWSQGVTRPELAGWVGDATSKADKPNMGNDDYKADLDAVNISALITGGGLSYSTAANQYYKDLAGGKYTRAGKFLENVGGIGVVEEQVRAYQQQPAWSPECTPETAGARRCVPWFFTVEVTNEDALRFLKSLEAGSNDLTD